MARLMLTWELGTGLGHAMPLAQLAVVLLDRGHEVHLAWKDLSLCREVLRETFAHPRLKIWQAPVWQRALRGYPDAATYPELLLRAGYLDAAELIGHARGWTQLIDAIRPALLVADYSPTAILAARELPLRTATFGSGFFHPPAQSPMPLFRTWEQVDESRTAASEARVLNTSNAVLDALGKKSISAVHELLHVDEHFLLGWSELDHYRSMRDGQALHSWGWPRVPDNRPAASWPLTAGPRLFAYLWRNHPAIDAILPALRQGPWSTLLCLNGTSDNEARQLSGERLTVTNRAVDLSAALDAADLLVSHAGSGTLYSALQAGRPALMLPMQPEQLLLAMRVAACGAGIVLRPQEVAAGMTKAIEALLGSPGFTETARSMAAHHSDTAGNDVLERIADRCEALIA